MNHKLMYANFQRFFAFENGAVKIYDTLALHVEDPELADYLIKFRDIESKHVRFWDETLRQFGWKPTYKMGNFLANAAKVSSHGIGLLPTPAILQIAFYLENLAIVDYQYFSQQYQEEYPDLAKEIWDLKTDEELHGLWLKEKAEELTKTKV